MLATSLPSAATLAAGAAIALVLIAALVALLRRHTDAFPLLAVFALPFRLPISTDGRTVNLLIPLYLVVAAGTLTHLLPRLLGGGRADKVSGPWVERNLTRAEQQSAAAYGVYVGPNGFGCILRCDRLAVAGH